MRFLQEKWRQIWIFMMHSSGYKALSDHYLILSVFETRWIYFLTYRTIIKRLKGFKDKGLYIYLNSKILICILYLKQSQYNEKGEIKSELSSRRRPHTVALTWISIWPYPNSIHFAYHSEHAPNFLLRLYDSLEASENSPFFFLHKDMPVFHYHSFICFDYWNYDIVSYNL